jgi:hypothetical protein
MVKKCGLLEEQAGQHHPLPPAGPNAILCADTSLCWPVFSRAGRQLTVNNGYEKGEQDGCHPDELFHVFFKLGLTLVMLLVGSLAEKKVFRQNASAMWKKFHFTGEAGSVCFDEVKLIRVCASLLVYPVGAARFM